MMNTTNTFTLHMKKIRWNDQDYQKALALRNELLNESAQMPILTTAPLDEKNALHLAAFLNDEMVGTLYIKQVAENACQVKQVAISNNCQGLGLGKKLIAYAEETASMIGLPRILIEGRESAWGFYEKLGYVAVSSPYLNESGALYLQMFEKNIDKQYLYNSFTINIAS